MAVTDRLKKADRNRLAWGGVALGIVFFLSLNVLSQVSFAGARIDLTADRLYTISDGTKKVLASIKEPIELRLYISEGLRQLGPFYTNHARRVRELLDTYVRLADGKLEVREFDPTPFSPEEDQAVADGVRGAQLADGGADIYFGLAGSNSTDDQRSVPFLTPTRGAFLEYDLTRLVYDLANPEKPKVAIIGDLPLIGSPAMGYGRQWMVLDMLEQFFEVEPVIGPVETIDEDVKVVLLAQPRSLEPKTAYAIDQFVMRGGRVLAFIDPYAESMQTRQTMMAPAATGKAIEATEPLLASWGIEIPKDKIVGDRIAATRVRAPHEGREVITDYLAWLMLDSGALAQDEVITGNLNRLNLKSSGFIRAREGATTSIKPIVTSSSEAMAIDVAKVAMAPDPVGLLNEFKPADEPFTLAARITGPAKSAFPDGPPEDVENDEALRAAHTAEAVSPINLIVVADADLLADGTWARMQELLGQQLMVPIANNADFTGNALDFLAGSEALLELRGRGVTPRPFEVLESIRRQAEDQYRATEQQLLKRIEDMQSKIGELQKASAEGEVILTAEQQEEIEKTRTEMLALRQQLRDVQFALRKDTEQLKSWIRVLNIWAVPALVGLCAVGLAGVRRWRARRFHAMGSA